MKTTKFYSLEEVRAVRKKAAQLRDSGKFEGIRNWFLIEFDLNTGLRVSELADLVHGDIYCGLGKQYVEVREGKGKKYRVVIVAESFIRDVYSYYVSWKEACGLSTANDAPVFTKRNGRRLTPRALQKAFAKCAASAAAHRKNTHSLRHTYSTYLDIVTGRADARLVQEQLGHASVVTTERYLGENTPEEFKKVALERLYALFKGELDIQDLIGPAYASNLFLPCRRSGRRAHSKEEQWKKKQSKQPKPV